MTRLLVLLVTRFCLRDFVALAWMDLDVGSAETYNGGMDVQNCVNADLF